MPADKPKSISVQTNYSSFQVDDTGSESNSESDDFDSRSSLVRSFILGGMDGIAASMTMVAIAYAASLSSNILFLFAFSVLVSSGVSVGVSDALSINSNLESYRQERFRQAKDFDKDPAMFLSNIVDIYVTKGFSVQDAEILVQVLSKNKRAVIDVLMIEYHGTAPPMEASVLSSGLVTLFAYCGMGALPLVPSVLHALGYLSLPVDSHRFFASASLAGSVMLLLGAWKSQALDGSDRPVLGGLRSLVNASLSALVGFSMGWALSSFVDY